MFKFLNYFRHQDIYKSRGEIRKYILIPVSVTVLLFALVAPLAVVTPVVVFFLGALIFNYCNFHLYPLVCYSIGIVLSYILRLGYSGYSNYSEVISSSFVLITIARTLNLRSYRDSQIILILLICANASILLLDTSATLILFSVANSFYILSQLLRMHIKEFSLSILLSSMRGAMRVVLYSLPLMVLFVWLFKQSNIPKSYRGENSTGVSTNMQPGEYSKLTNNHGIVFRVVLNRYFPSDLEAPYWRVATLTKGMGLHWTDEKNKRHLHRLDLANSKCIFKQTFYRQDLDLKVLSAALDYPLQSNAHGERVYTAISDICESRRDDKPQAFSQSPKFASSDQMKMLLASLGSRGESASTVVDRLMSFFRKNSFKVTMEPKALPYGREFESFLFKTKEGYCEHFAGATATILQLKNIPARVVVGYAGGRFNRLANYWQISYADSHAWVEYWNGKTWMRVDPTVIVGNDLSGKKKYDDFYDRVMGIPGVEQLWFAIDALSFKVQKTFINAEKIIALEDLSYDPWLVLASLVLLFIGVRIKKYQRPADEKIRAEFQNFCQLISDRGVPRGRIEGFDSYRKKVVTAIASKGELKNKVDDLFNNYIDFRYGKEALDKDSKNEFLKKIKLTTKLYKKEAKAL